MRSTMTRLKFASLTAVLLAFVLALLFGCASGSPPQAAPDKGQAVPERPATYSQPSLAAPNAPSYKQAKVYIEEATVTSVSDGDTVHVKLNGRDERVRMIGVNCPEISHPDLDIKEEPYGREAKAYTEERLAGKKVWLEVDVQERDKYGRLLAYVWLEPPSSASEQEVRAKMYNARLLLDGYAQAMTVPPNVKYADLFAKLQREAREKGRGLWGAAAGASIAKPSASVAKAAYIGNSRTKVFHLPGCRWAGEISPANRVTFKSRAEAVNAGYRPCKVCRP